MKNCYFKIKLSALSFLLSCLILPLLHAQSLTFGMTNFSFSGVSPTFYEFDITVHASSSGTKLGNTQIFLNYNTLGFGSSIKTNSKVTVTKGSLISSALYSIIPGNDSTPSMYSFGAQYTTPGVPADGVDVPTVATPIFHVKIEIADPTKTSGLSFDSSLMDGEQYFSDNASSYSPIVATATDNSILPIEMTSFEAKVQEGAAVLHWTTASESNNEGFAVEHSTDAKMWKQVGFVQGNGTTTTAQNYIFNTENLAIGTHYFRLKQKDYSGVVKYSESVQVMVEVAGKFMLNPAYPNPFNPETNIEFAVATSQNVTMELYNTLGQRVALLYQGKPVANELQKVQINGSNLPSGIYMVRLTGENFRQTQKITLVK